MVQIGFRKEINWHCRYRSSQGMKIEYEILRIFGSGRGRIINSPAIRRLQQKTQVFPLECNAAVRTHLTHLMEVQQVGHCIAKEILSRLKELKLLEQYGLDELTGSFESIVEMSCLMHDIGSPPLGHFGEAAINGWFRQRLYPADVESQPLSDDRCQVTALRLREGEESLNDIRRKVRQDLCCFGDNAQGVRLAHTLIRMNLAQAQVDGILRYTRLAWWYGSVSETRNYLMEKPGYYLSGEPYIERSRKELSLAPYDRSPLIRVTGTADNVSHCVAGLKNVVEKRIFSVKQLYHHLYEAWELYEKDSLFSQVVEDAWEESRSNVLSRSTENQFLICLRVNTLNKLMSCAAQRFVDNLSQIYEGSFNHALLEGASSLSQLLSVYKNVTVKHVFSHPGVEQLELQDYRVVSGLLEIYQPLLEALQPDFSELVDNEKVKRFPIESHLSQELSTRHRLAYVEAANKVSTGCTEYSVLEYYHRCRLIRGYVNGMTDLYAWDEYHRLMVVEQ